MDVNNYECPNCHNVFPESNKFLHEQRCTASKPVPLNQSRVAFSKNQEEKNKKKEPIKHISQPNYQANKNTQIKEQNQTKEEDKEFTCWLCGNTLKEKEKADHMLCHQMQEENEEFKKNNQKLDNNNKKDNARPRRDLPRKEQNNNRIQNQNERNQGQRNNIENNQRRNLKRSQLKFSDWQIFDFGGLKSSLNKMENPTDVDILEQLPESEIEDTSQLTEDTSECHICLSNFSKSDKITIFPCTHMFHSFCVESWLNKKDFCPVCQKKIIKGTY